MTQKDVTKKQVAKKWSDLKYLAKKEHLVQFEKEINHNKEWFKRTFIC